MTDNHVQIVLNHEQMTRAEQLAVNAGDTFSGLMERAGRAVASVIQQHFKPCRVLVLCGSGNNGGDGFVAARTLQELGWQVTVSLYGRVEALKPHAAESAKSCQGGLQAFDTDLLENTDLVVDAIFGIGLDRPLEPPVSTMLKAASQAGIPIVAVDLPSGTHCDTGMDMGGVQSYLTVTFACKKPAHLLLPARDLCGKIVVADIGIPAAVLQKVSETAAHQVWENCPALWLHHMPVLLSDTHKYKRGHVLIDGSFPMTGASRLAARAAARMGAGLTTLAVPKRAFGIYAIQHLSIMVHALASMRAWQQLLEDPRFTAFLIGPGGGNSATVRKQLKEKTSLCLHTKKPVVIDADALNAFEDVLPSLIRSIAGDCVLTPHQGEFARLFGDHLDLSQDKCTLALSAARLSRSVVVLKGSDTVIASPQGQVIVNTNAQPNLATAGAGDVLAGMVAGLLAQGMPALHASAAAVWVHGAVATQFGLGLIAEDIPEQIPPILQDLLKQKAEQQRLSMSILL